MHVKKISAVNAGQKKEPGASPFFSRKNRNRFISRNEKSDVVAYAFFFI